MALRKILARNKITILVVLLGICSTLILVLEVLGNPSNPGSCTCHDAGPYRIFTHASNSFQVEPTSNFSIDITALGPGVIVQFHPDARDNIKFKVYPNDTIVDNTLFDENATADGVYVNFTLTAPNEEDTYTILIFARSPTGPQPQLVCIEFEVIIGWANPLNRIFNHWNIYLGLIALICLGVGTIIYEYDHQLIKAHGILATISLALTTINIVVSLPQTFEIIGTWTNPAYLDSWHLIHIVVGIVGYVAAVVAMIAGLGGSRARIPGYIALICWGFCFFYGIFAWGVNF